METGDLLFEDTNLAMLGSIYEKALRLQRAEGEPQWKTIKKEPSFYIWRIEKFNVVPWPKDQYGTFYQGDTFIILSIVKDPDTESLDYNAHMWVGQDTTCDESGTGAYKIVELNDYFNGEMTLIYEEQGFESPLFISYFQNINILSGGIETGFKKVGAEKYASKLLHVRGVGKCIEANEVPFVRDSMNDEDVFIFDLGLKLINWRGSKSNGFEKFHGSSLCNKIKQDRGGKPSIEEIEEGEKEDEINKIFEQNKPQKLKSRNPRSRLRTKASQVGMDKGCHNKMMKLSENDGKFDMSEVPFEKGSLKSDDIYLIDRGDCIIIWTGKNASNHEKKFGIVFARKYQNDENRNRHLPILQVREGKMQKEVDACFQ